MSQEQIKQKAQQSIEDALSGGQSITQGDMQLSRVSVKDAFEIANYSEDIVARKAGRRPLFRSFNLSGMNT